MQFTTNALAYAKHLNWPVFPLNGKKPFKEEGLTEHGYLDATTDPEVIKKWGKRWPNANIGVPTGVAINAVVLDVDPRNGGSESLFELISQHGTLPETVSQKTGGGGMHYFFQHPGKEISCKSDIKPGIDIKADGGYIVVAPSIHPISKQAYKWDVSPRQSLMGEIPKWLLDLLNHKQSGKRVPASEWRQIAAGEIKEGERNSTMTRMCGMLLHRKVDPYVTFDLLLAWNQKNCHPPLDDREVHNIVSSISRAEAIQRGLIQKEASDEPHF